MSITNAITQSSFVRGDIKNTPIKILVDTGSHYSFVTPTRAQELQLAAEAIPTEELEAAGGNKIYVTEWVPKVPITIHTV